jgi:ABC-type tungstate transport system substrate-binding protein
MTLATLVICGFQSWPGALLTDCKKYVDKKIHFKVLVKTNILAQKQLVGIVIFKIISKLGPWSSADLVL